MYCSQASWTFMGLVLCWPRLCSSNTQGSPSSQQTLCLLPIFLTSLSDGLRKWGWDQCMLSISSHQTKHPHKGCWWPPVKHTNIFTHKKYNICYCIFNELHIKYNKYINTQYCVRCSGNSLEHKILSHRYTTNTYGPKKGPVSHSPRFWLIMCIISKHKPYRH